MSDELFENDSNDGDKADGVVIDIKEETEEEEVPIKVKKPRKPLSEERKNQLREQLKRGRETSLAKRTKGKQKKDLVKLKVEESKIEKVYKEKVMNDQQREQELEEKLTKKIMARMKKEAAEEARANELISLRAEVQALKKAKAKPLPTIKEEPIIPKAPVPVAPQYNKFSPSNHFMGGFY
jgi:hypothetical protein